MSTCTIPASGALTTHWYVEETVCNVTPASPVFKPIRYTSGNIKLTKDSLQSNEIDGSREVADIRLGQNQATGEISVELSYGSYDDLLEGALGSDWSTPVTATGVTVSVTSSTKRYTRTAGSYLTDGVVVGDLIKFAGFTNAGNNGIFRVKSVAALHIVVEDADSLLVTESGTLVSYATSAKLQVGSERKTFTIMTHYADADSGAGEYHITTGAEITAYSFDCSVNGLVTGSFTIIGRNYIPDTTEPSGATYSIPAKTEVFASVDGQIAEGSSGATYGFATGLSFKLDNASAAKFVIGDDFAAFIEQGRANSTLSLNTFFMDSAMLSKFTSETESRVNLLLLGNNGAMSFRFPRVIYTSGAPDLGGEGSIMLTMEAQALKPTSATETSVEIRRLA